MFQLIEYAVYFILCHALTQLLTCTSVYLNPSGLFSIWSSSKWHKAFFSHAKGSTPVLPSAISLGSYINLLTMWNCSGLLHGWWPIHQCSWNRVCDSKDEDSSASAPTCITRFSISVFTFGFIVLSLIFLLLFFSLWCWLWISSRLLRITRSTQSMNLNPLCCLDLAVECSLLLL